jgi:NAD(P)-dependent dehydrogenase (short-subunit alcohol dehydrogenase family)
VSDSAVFDLSGRIALIVGAGSGLGRAIALGFARFGAIVAAADINLEKAKETVEQVRGRGGDAAAYQVDVSDDKAVQNLISGVVEKSRRIDILVNSAGVASHAPAESMGIEEWNRVINANLNGTFFCCQAAGAVMLRQGKGSIINIVSVGGLVAVGRGTSAYGASKGGVVMLTRELAVEWGSRGLRVNAIAPCQFRTPMLEAVLQDPQYDPDLLMQTWITNIPLGRIGEMEEIVGPAIFLASDSASMVTGHILAVDGGFVAR